MSELKLVVVGAYGGIGRALCSEVSSKGGRAFLIGRDALKMSEVAQEFGFPSCVADATDWDQIESGMEQASASMQGINAVVCLAGSVLLKPLHLTSRAEWDSTLQTNLTAAAGTLRAAVSRMKDGGSVVLMSSAAAGIGLSNHEAIAAGKAGIEGLVRSAAMTYAARAIRVNAVAPGLVQTPLTQRVWSNTRSAEVSLAMHPLGRFGKPEEIGRAIYFLIEPSNNWITGQVLGVDGGLGTLKPTGTPKSV
ncbi:MAG: 2,5-dichloro-2,5-cyclohexadiene,4-diol dehydrogenase [Planctomycetota bacterium]|jgi:NAD(P)-dependent dehydrogenase (short-subunit alcohol dehydrogenase family)